MLLDAPSYSCRYHYAGADRLGYTQGFGSTLKAPMFGLYERIAKTFEVLPQSPA